MKRQRVVTWMLLASFLLGTILPLAVGFCSPPAFSRHSITTRIRSTASEEPVDVTETLESKLFPDATVLDFTLEKHKPLGCTVEESLAHPMEKHIFVTKVCYVEGIMLDWISIVIIVSLTRVCLLITRSTLQLVDDGLAQTAGLQVGDVLLAVPGIFGDLTDVVGLGIEQV